MSRLPMMHESGGEGKAKASRVTPPPGKAPIRVRACPAVSGCASPPASLLGRVVSVKP